MCLFSPFMNSYLFTLVHLSKPFIFFNFYFFLKLLLFPLQLLLIEVRGKLYKIQLELILVEVEASYSSYLLQLHHDFFHRNSKSSLTHLTMLYHDFKASPNTPRITVIITRYSRLFSFNGAIGKRDTNGEE